MPIKIPNNLPARGILEGENIFVMDADRAYSQDIRPLRILLLNLMPIKPVTETQFLRLLGNTALQVEIDFIYTRSYTPTHTSADYLTEFYGTHADVAGNNYDGLIITGAPVELLDFEQVAYWSELTEILDWSLTHVFSTLHVCWGAQAALYHRYGIEKYPLESKLSGVYAHRVVARHEKLMRGFDDQFYAPHSRYTGTRRDDLLRANLSILAESEEAGVYIAADLPRRLFYITGHAEYDADTLLNEFNRDNRAGLQPAIPKNYFPEDDPNKEPIVLWRSTAHMLFANWLNYYVYQQTPYELAKIGSQL